MTGLWLLGLINAYNFMDGLDGMAGGVAVIAGIFLCAIAFREDFALFGYVIRAYWRCGFWRWFATFRRYDGDLRVDPPPNAVMIAGRDDPLPDREFIRDLQGVAGAHACHFAYSEPVADQLSDLVVDRSRPDSLSRA